MKGLITTKHLVLEVSVIVHEFGFKFWVLAVMGTMNGHYKTFLDAVKDLDKGV